MRATTQIQLTSVRVHLASTTIWSAAAERSGDGAFLNPGAFAESKAASHCVCRRTPQVRPGDLWVVVARCALLVLLSGTYLAASTHALAQTNNSPATSPRYETRADHDRDGIGKFYMGREIAQVMGHQAADWLERPERETEERPELALPALKLKSGDAVADIGAGSGYYTRRLAKLVGEKGIVYAVDIQQEMLDLLINKMAEANIHNVKPILGDVTTPRLPRGSVDLALLVDVYHEFDHPYEMIEAICASLKPGGRVAFVEFRGEDPKVPIKALHKMTEAQVRKEMSAQPLEWVETSEVLPWQHIIIFRKKNDSP